MTAITARNILRHELIGLKIRVARSTNRQLVGMSGVVVDETKNMLLIRSSEGPKSIPKNVCVFYFTLPDRTVVKVDGKRLAGRAEARLKTPVVRW